MEMRDLYSNNPKRVLIIAIDSFASSLCRAIRDLRTGDGSTISVELMGAHDLDSLGARLFELDDTSSEQTQSLFAWGLYDYIIIQDLFLTAGNGLGAAGHVLARWDDYERGNRTTTKIIALTDPCYTWWRLSNSVETSHKSSAIGIKKYMDEKALVQMIDMSTAESLQTLRAIIRGNGSLANADDNVPAPTMEKRHGFETMHLEVLENIAKSLRQYVFSCANLVIIDDDAVGLNETVNVIQGTTGKSILETPSRQVHTVALGNGAPPRIKSTSNFNELREVVLRQLDNCQENGQYGIVITDIVFPRENWATTGIDLIEAICERKRSPSDSALIGTIAFTGFSSPFLFMAAYQRQADMVLTKSASSRESFVHDSVTQLGAFRLLLSVAFLCFQQQYLSKLKEQCHVWRNRNDLSKDQFKKTICELSRILPSDGISFPVRSQWHEIRYLLTALQFYPSGSRARDLAFDGVANAN